MFLETETLGWEPNAQARETMSSYQEGMDAYERGDYETALKEFRHLAEQGEAEAQLVLGLQVPATVSLNVSDNGLAAIADIDVLNRDALLSVLPHLV